MEQTGAEAPEQAGAAALHPHLPPQSSPAGQQHPAKVDEDRGARGEHVHSEPAPPVRAVRTPSGAGVPGAPNPAGVLNPPNPPIPPIPAGAVTPPGAPSAAPEAPHARATAGARTTARAPKKQGAPKPPRHAKRPADPRQQPERHSVRAQVLRALREALLSGELAPGEVYSAPALADRLGVSATPVREAMQQLVCEAAVETVPNRGFRVAVCSARDLAELAEIRALLEIPSVLEAARSMPPECWESLRPYADEALVAATSGDRSAYADADSAFHGALLELTGNRQLVAVAKDIHRRTRRRPAPALPSTSAAEFLKDASDHVVLLDALRDRDLAAVERLMREHVAL